MKNPETMRTKRVRHYWDRTAARYDERVARVEERYLAPSRRWVCERAAGEVLEIAVGSGLNLPHYSPGVKLIGVDLSEGMLQLARRRAAIARREVELLWADGARLPFGDESFDAVVCTFSLCGFPDPRAGVEEMVRVLRPKGSLLLADHIGSTKPLIRVGQWALQAITILAEGEHWTRRPRRHVEALGLHVVEADRLHHGIIERLHASREAR
jgi:ubiquinone/menaquinone biosynthesis methyltransferase